MDRYDDRGRDARWQARSEDAVSESGPRSGGNRAAEPSRGRAGDRDARFDRSGGYGDSQPGGWWQGGRDRGHRDTRDVTGMAAYGEHGSSAGYGQSRFAAMQPGGADQSDFGQGRIAPWGDRDAQGRYGFQGNGDRLAGDGGHGGGPAGYWDQKGRFSQAGWNTADAWATDGPHAGRGPRGYRRPDDRIRDDVCERLTYHGGIDATDIEVQVHDGEVTLAGTVDRREMKRLAEDTAERVSGVRDIHNQIRVRRPLGSSQQAAQGESTSAFRPDTTGDKANPSGRVGSGTDSAAPVTGTSVANAGPMGQTGAVTATQTTGGAQAREVGGMPSAVAGGERGKPAGTADTGETI